MRHLLPRRIPPRQRERLRGHPAHITVEVQQHRVIALQPRLEPDVPPRRRKPPQTREMPLPPVRGELPHRTDILERDPSRGLNPATVPSARISPADLCIADGRIKAARI